MYKKILVKAYFPELTFRGSFRNAAGSRVTFRGEMGSDHSIMPVRFDDELIDEISLF
jgi:hypothetical protein